jgi:serine/threonine-protein kinase
LREDLYRVIHYYAELSKLARKGVVDPISQIGRILEKRLPYVLLVIRDMLPALEKGELTYYEALNMLIREARKITDQKLLIQSRQEIEKIESQGRVFVYAVKWADAADQLRPNPAAVDKMQKTLMELNKKYKRRYATEDDEKSTLIPYYMARDESEPEEVTLGRAADLVRRALLELYRLSVEDRPSFFASLFSKGYEKDMKDDLMRLAWFLIRCGYTVDRIASGYYKDALSDFLDESLLDFLIRTHENVRSLVGMSTHLMLISAIDFGSFYELATDYCDLEDPAELAHHLKSMAKKRRKGGVLLNKLSRLHSMYGSVPQGTLARKYLSCRYQAAFGAYHGVSRQEDPRVELAISLYKPVVDRSAMDKRAQKDLQESGRCFSSKTQAEMTGILTLIMDSLENPKKVKGTKVKILGDISSGSMGKVSVGIYHHRIVALKSVKSQIPQVFGDPEILLQYEAAMHARVQQSEQHPYIVEYYGLVEQEGEKLLINSYHPNDSLTQLVEKNWTAKFKPPLTIQSDLSFATLEVIVNQLLECLRHFRLKGIVHRDLKTDNILYLVGEDGALNRIKVIDFGVALSIGPGAIDDIFKGKVVGTFSYMAPEQSRGRSTFESDLYSVGAIITVLLTGKLPIVFPKATTREELSKQILRVQEEPRTPLTRLNPRLEKNSALEHIAGTVGKMLELDPAKRPTLEDLQHTFDHVFQYLGDKKNGLFVFYDRG